MNKPVGAAWALRIACWKLQSQVVPPTTTESHRETRKHRPVTVSAAAIFLAAALGGCGGGGGDSSSAPPDASYPTLSNSVINSSNGGVTANYSRTADQLTPVEGDVIFSLNAQSFSIVANLLGHPTFDFTVDRAALRTLVNSPLNSCTTCLRAGPTTAAPPDGNPVSFIYLDPSIAGTTYSTLGLWSKPTITVGTDVGAAFSIGVVTRHQDLPIFGSPPTYNGVMVGRYTDSLKTYAVAANVTAVITFNVSGSVVTTFTTTNTYIAEELADGTLAPPEPAQSPALNLTTSSPLTYSTSTNSLTGNPGNLSASGLSGGNMIGLATAQYYGPPTSPGATPAEFGGTFFVGNGQERMTGSFVLKKL